MKKEKKLKKESFMSGVLVLMLSHILIKVLGLIYKVYLTNKEGFGDKGNAIYSSGFQIYALLLTVSFKSSLAHTLAIEIKISNNKTNKKLIFLTIQYTSITLIQLYFKAKFKLTLKII